MLGDVIRACMAREILVQLSTETHKFEKYLRGATKYTRVTRTRASSLNPAVPYVGLDETGIFNYKYLLRLSLLFVQ